MTIKKLFEPNSIAVVGASRNPQKVGHKILKNLVEADFEGRIYPVNPNADELLGLTCYSSLEEAPKKTQLAVIAVPAEQVPSVLEKCEENNVGSAIIISSGFAESGEDGKKLEKEVSEIAEEMGIRILGPNSQGVNNTSRGLCATWPLITKEGPISVVTQSGTVGATIASRAQRDNIGISKLAVVGNGADVDEADLLDYLADDEETEVIALYLEGLKNGRKFLKSAKKIAAEKPVVVLKGGNTEAGAELVKFHSPSPVGKYEVFESAFREAGLIQANNIGELYEVCKGIATLPKPDNKNTVVITSSGGSGILAVDKAEGLDVNLVDLPEKSIERLEEALPPECIIGNPLDLTGSVTGEMLDESIKILARYKDIQIMVVIMGDPVPGGAEVIRERFERLTMVPVILGSGKEEETEKNKLIEAKIPVFSEPETAMKVLDAL